jgi:hypothetical protein
VLLNKNDKILCLGARTGHEVIALQNLGFKKNFKTFHYRKISVFSMNREYILLK